MRFFLYLKKEKKKEGKKEKIYSCMYIYTYIICIYIYKYITYVYVLSRERGSRMTARIVCTQEKPSWMLGVKKEANEVCPLRLSANLQFLSPVSNRLRHCDNLKTPLPRIFSKFFLSSSLSRSFMRHRRRIILHCFPRVANSLTSRPVLETLTKEFELRKAFQLERTPGITRLE